MPVELADGLGPVQVVADPDLDERAGGTRRLPWAADAYSYQFGDLRTVVHWAASCP